MLMKACQRPNKQCPLIELNMNFPENGFLSPDNPPNPPFFFLEKYLPERKEIEGTDESD